MKTLLFCFAAMALCCSAVLGLINVPSDGSDGAFNPVANVEVDLSQTVTGTWNQAGTGTGVYDAGKWAVVFKYSSVNIPAGVIVTFKNHPSRAPVVWLVQGNVTIAGAVSLDGQDCIGGDPQGLARKLAESGPGGFRGGAAPCVSLPGGPGLGPGGGSGNGATGSFGYGNAGLLPIIGGSGGAATATSGG